MKRKMKSKRHGDVLLVPLEIEIEGQSEKDCVLALGEVTGHSHRIEKGTEKVLFNPSFESHKRAHQSTYETLKSQFEKEFPGESFPFKKEDIEIGCFIRVKERSTLIHEEHGPIELLKNTNHAVIIQRDYTPLGWSKALD